MMLTRFVYKETLALRAVALSLLALKPCFVLPGCIVYPRHAVGVIVTMSPQARGLEGAEADPTAWEVRMAAKYYKLLFKEYALADLSR